MNESQSPSEIIILNGTFPNEPNVKSLTKYNIIVTTSFDCSYNDDYQNKSKLPIPREYIINQLMKEVIFIEDIMVVEI